MSFADKKVKDLTEDDMLTIIIDMNDSGQLTWKKWKRVLQRSFVLHNYLSDEGMVKNLKMIVEEAEAGKEEDMEMLKEAIEIYSGK